MIKIVQNNYEHTSNKKSKSFSKKKKKKIEEKITREFGTEKVYSWNKKKLSGWAQKQHERDKGKNQWTER